MITIREETPQDFAAVRAIHRQAFPTALESQLVDELRANGKAIISLVAEPKPSIAGGLGSPEQDGAVVGHVLFSPVSVGERDAGLTRALGLAPVAVSPAFQSKGVGSALITAGLDQARSAGYRFVVVLGEPAYYARFGFRTASLSGLTNEYGVDEPFMVFELAPGALAGISGLVKYAPEFAAFS